MRPTRGVGFGALARTRPATGAKRWPVARFRPRENKELNEMKIERRFTTSGQSPYASIEFRTTKSEIRNPDGSVVFSLDNIEVPASWSQVAADVLAQKYFRKAGVPARLKRVEENAVPSFLWRSVADTEALADLPKDQRATSETKAQQVFDRLAGAWTYWGWKGGYFDTEADAEAYFDETRFMLARQMAAHCRRRAPRRRRPVAAIYIFLSAGGVSARSARWHCRDGARGRRGRGSASASR